MSMITEPVKTTRFVCDGEAFNTLEDANLYRNMQYLNQYLPLDDIFLSAQQKELVRTKVSNAFGRWVHNILPTSEEQTKITEVVHYEDYRGVPHKTKQSARDVNKEKTIRHLVQELSSQSDIDLLKKVIVENTSIIGFITSEDSN